MSWDLARMLSILLIRFLKDEAVYDSKSGEFIFQFY